MLLDLARNVEAGGGNPLKFIVKDFVKAGDYARLCALTTDGQGHINNTDGGLDVSMYAFVRHKQRWLVMRAGESFADEKGHVECGTESLNEADELESDLQSWLESNLHWNLEQGRANLAPDVQAVLDALREKRVLKNLAVDDESSLKTNAGQYALDTANKLCKRDAACMAANRAALATLKSLGDKPDVSSLVIAECGGKDVYDGKLGEAVQCIRQFAARPYCRVGMQYPENKADVERCVDEVADFRQRLSKPLGASQ